MLRLQSMPCSPWKQEAMGHAEGEQRRAEEQVAEAVMMKRRAGAGINTDGGIAKTLVSDGMFRE